jgi:hypothetical protein
VLAAIEVGRGSSVQADRRSTRWSARR